MDNYGVGRLWNHARSIFSRKRYEGVSRNRDDDNIGLVGARASAGTDTPSLRSKPSTFSLSSSLTSFSTLRPAATFASKSSLKKSSNEDITLLELSGAKKSPHKQQDQDEDVEKDTIPKKHPQWIDGVYMCAKAGAVVFLLNLVFIGIAAGLASRFPDNEGFGSSAVIYRGSCGISKRWNTALHLIINILSTCILAASNYCMQTLVAPTREEVDAHHAQWKWLDIGSASVKNLFAIERYRLVLWVALMITATPFHLMYNSMVFSSLSTNQFGVVVGPRDLNSSNVHSLTTPALEKCFSNPAVPMVGDTFASSIRWNDFADEIASGNYDRISLSECKSKTQTTATGVRAIVALASNITVSDGGDFTIRLTDVDNVDIQTSSSQFQDDTLPSVFFVNQTAGTGANATCQAKFDLDYTFVQINKPGDVAEDKMVNLGQTRMMPIEECLVIRAEEHCQLLYSPPICLVIMLAAFAKVSAMFLAAHIGRSRSAPLLTIGDAVASFMETPDQTTKRLCWITGSDVRDGIWTKATKSGFQAVLTDQSDPVAYRRLRKRGIWGKAASGWRWAATLCMCFSCIIVGSVLFVMSTSAGAGWLSANTFKNWFSSDVDISDDKIISGDTVGLSMLASVVVANVPQLVVTMSYYCYNAVLTSMLAAGEYSSYGAKRKALRVTWPVKGSQQRSTYWLSVPYRYGIPILILYMILHWLISESIFYLLLITYDPQNERDPGNKISSLGYSSTPIFMSIMVGSIMVLILIVLAFRKFKSNMPITGSSSVAISAACHLPKDENGEAAVLEKVKWGETPLPPAWEWENNQFQDGIDDGQKGHCSFTSLETEKPSLMKLYA